MVMKQDELGRLLRQMVPPVDETGVWPSIQDRAASGPRRQGRLLFPVDRRRLACGLVYVAVGMVVIVALGFGVNALLEHLGKNEHILVITDSVADPDSALTGSSVFQPSETGITVSIPPEFSQFGGLVERLVAQGVAVAELREMPYAQDYGTGVEVVLRSQASDQKATPEDALAVHLVFRAAVLEKMAGTDIEAVGVAFLRSGKIEFHSVVPIDKAIDPSWYITPAPGLSLQQAAKRAEANISARLVSSPFRLTQLEVTQDPDGTRVLRAELDVAAVSTANQAIDDLDTIGEVVGALNQDYQAKIGVIRTEINTTGGEPVLWSIRDLQLKSSTWWQDEGITEGAYPRPAIPSTPDQSTSTTVVHSGATDWPVNAQGQTYGSSAGAASAPDEPDLVLAQATNGRVGYVLATDLEGPMPASPEEALAWQAASAGKTRVIPVYLADGVTIIGEFQVGPGTAFQIPPASGFRFVAAYGAQGQNTIDTGKGIFTKDLGPQEDPVITELALSPEALELLYRELVLMENRWGIFTAGFDPDPDPSNTGTTAELTPCRTYALQWSGEGFDAQPILWKDSALSADPAAVALRNWFDTLRMMIEATPEWRALPPMTGGYQ